VVVDWTKDSARLDGHQPHPQATTVDRFDDSIRPLAAFPMMGPALGGRWSGYRYILGPWRWMLIVYEYHDGRDVVGIVTVQDARSERAPTATPWPVTRPESGG
jgi:plasmid stabilization system protein ParE